MMKLPCEQALWYVLPQIRADLTRELVKQGLKQKDVAKLLDITPSAVSQYLHKKRGNKKKMPPGYNDEIVEISKRLRETADDAEISMMMCRCCKKALSD